MRRSETVEDDVEPRDADPQAVRTYSLYEHEARTALVQHLGTAADADGARAALLTWEGLQHERQEQTVADVWRRVGRFLIASGAGTAGGPQDWGAYAWRRLYLTEVAPWTHYAEGDEYVYLGMTPPER